MVDTLFTIDYSNRSIEDLIDLLKEHKIAALCDVRSAPYSSRNPQFNREVIQQALRKTVPMYLELAIRELVVK